MSDDAGSAEKEVSRRLSEMKRNLNHSRITPEEFKVILRMAMVCDPFPLSDIEHDTFIGLLNRYSECYGYSDWVEAYHNM